MIDFSIHSDVAGTKWMTKEHLENAIIETITDKHYTDFVTTMDRLLAHPYSYRCKDFIMKYRQDLGLQQNDLDIVEPKIREDGRKYVTTYGNLFIKSNRVN